MQSHLYLKWPLPLPVVTLIFSQSLCENGFKSEYPQCKAQTTPLESCLLMCILQALPSVCVPLWLPCTPPNFHVCVSLYLFVKTIYSYINTIYFIPFRNFYKYINNYVHSHQQMDPMFAVENINLVFHSTQESGNPWGSRFYYFKILECGSSHEQSYRYCVLKDILLKPVSRTKLSVVSQPHPHI